MKAIVIDEFVTDLNNLKVSEISEPAPEPGKILIRVKGAGVNFVDTLYAQGRHQNNKFLVRPPFILGLEFSGVVISAPPNSSLRPGDRVFGSHTGSYSEVISVSPSAPVHRVPTDWTFAQAAGIAATLPVSYAALVLGAGIKAGQTILVHAAAGGLGIMAVQIAAALGCRVIGTAGATEKCAVAKKFGAHACVNYTQEPSWWDRVSELTDGKGVDVVFDPVGLVDSSLKCIAHRGKILVVGFAGIQNGVERIAMNRVLLKQASLIGYRYGESSRRYPEEQGIIWNGLLPLIEHDHIRPVVFECDYRGLESVPRALRDMVERKIWGKAVINLDHLVPDPSRARL